ncbi:MAG: amino acid ABC transporter substrate-binding protein [Lachnospiraceae bacterium]|nr:amino acid ABC transporter substrate-binding protein [Lachnospiraceae bacterium]
MFNKKIKALLAVACIAVMGSAVLAGCESSNSNNTANNDAQVVADDAADDAAADDAAGAGFTEIPIFEDEELSFINLSAVYFQPVPMSDGTKAEDYDIHLEADVSALENDFGYELGSWIPYLTVDYAVKAADGTVAAQGTFMEMAASDGPHYGANIKLPDAGTYSLTITIHSPADNDYLLHTDSLTGPGAKSFDEAFTNGVLEYTYEGWDYTGPVEIPAN